MKQLKQSFLFTLIALIFSILNVNAEDSNAKKEGEKFDAGKLIVEHVADSHEWHVVANVVLPLPVIIYTDKGFDVFSSSKFEDGAIYHGKYNYKLEENHIKAVNDAGQIDEAATDKLYDISITKNVASLLFSAFILLYVFLSVARTYTRNPNRAPKGLQAAVEPLIVFVRDEVAKPAIGEKHYQRFMPFILTVFFFIWLNNMLGILPIIPGGANVTGNIAVTLILALFTFVITTVNGKRHYWRHIIAMPGVPVGILFILTPIEIMGVFLKPFVLMIRLFANIIAGHIIALSFFSLIFIFGEMNAGAGFGVAIFSVAFMIFMWLLEVLVAFIQAYVFALLSAIYFGSALEEEHEHLESAI